MKTIFFLIALSIPVLSFSQNDLPGIFISDTNSRPTTTKAFRFAYNNGYLKIIRSTGNSIGVVTINNTYSNPSWLVSLNKSKVGLGSADNTSDLSKPISTLTQAALDTKAPLNNPIFTGTVSGVTKAMVGLPNADNTSDINKPISTATQTALNLKTAYVAVADMTAFNALSATPATVVIVDVASDTVRNSGNPSRYEIWPSGRKWWNASIPIN